MLKFSAGFLVGVLLTLLVAGRRPTPVVLPPRVIVDTVELFRERPQVVPTLPERILTTRNRPTTIATGSVPNPGATAPYCAPRTDTLWRTDTLRPAPPALVPPVDLRYGRGRLQLWTYLGDGTPYYQEHRVRTPFSVLHRDSTFDVRGPRFGWWPAVRNCVVAGTAGAVAARWLTEHDPLVAGAVFCGTSLLF